jgi:DNA-binding NarL/FixJ family response regulator
VLAAGDREAAQAEWRRAVETATALRADPLHRALTDLGRRARFTPSDAVPETGHDSAPAADPTALSRLTNREREVLALVAEGLANREIAARLFIAQKTVSVHITNILGKLGVSSRTQAAAIAHREGLHSS